MNKPWDRGFHGNRPGGDHKKGKETPRRIRRRRRDWPYRDSWRNRTGNDHGNTKDNYDHQDGHTRHTERNIPEKSMGFSYVIKLLNNEDLQEVILQLGNDRNGFSKLLDSKEISNDLIVLLIKLLWKICPTSFQDVKIMILTTALNSTFMEKLILYINLLISQTEKDKLRNKYFWDNMDDFWNNLLNLCKSVLEIIPSNCETIKKLLKTICIFFPEIESTHSIHIPEEIKAQAAHLLDIVETTIKTIEVKRQLAEQNLAFKDLEPPGDFRDIKIIPNVQEIVAEVSPFLRQNIVDRAYDSVNQYLDIQFRLLREDFVAPLRRGITTLLRNQTKPKKEWKKLDDIKVYSPIKFLNIENVNECNCYRLQFDFSEKKRSFTYENSKRFMFGSLVCFTCDNFKTLFFGKIVQRDEKLLKNGLLIVGFQEEVEIDYEMDYLMVESNVYFEPYYQVLEGLKRIDAASFPMEKYIIGVKTESNPPEYLLKPNPVKYEIQRIQFSPLNFPLEKRFFKFNDSQLSAFKAALTEEFCIIQGPPGTGKTFLGLKIAQTLLENKHAWYNQTPILVICYTNHALDQFLEGLIPVTEKILRVGGQSKNEHLKKYNLSDMRRCANYRAAAVTQKRREVGDCVKCIKTINNTLHEIDQANDIIFRFDCFKDVIENYKSTWFGQNTQDNIMEWLLEGKRRNQQLNQNRSYQRQVQEEIQNMEVSDEEEEKMEDLNLDDQNLFLDDLYFLYNDIVVQNGRPLITVQELKDKLKTLNKVLDSLFEQPQTFDVMLQQQRIQHEIWETHIDLQYIITQLIKFEDQQHRIKPEHIDLINPFNMCYDDRWQLYFYWLEQYKAHLRRRNEGYNKKFKNTSRVYNEMRDIEDVQIMKKHLVVGMTTTGAARLQSSLQALKSPILIVEEAAEVLEAHIVTALTNHCKHLILIGDHFQLKPGTADYKIETKFKLGISLFERMVNNNIQCHTLNVQHRMRPEISRLIKPHIYENLEDHKHTLQRAPILGMEKCLYFLDHQEQEDLCRDASKKNIHECLFLMALARHLVLNGYKAEQITILAAYLGQFYEMIRERKKAINRMYLQDVKICVLDNYQGEESDIILLSLVRSNSENKAGFLRIQNRVCVALSRARDGLYIIGNMSLLLKSSSENQIWEKVNAVLEEQKAIGTHLTLKCQIHPERMYQVSKSQDFFKLNEGGCDQMCQVEMACGHICKRLCHVQDRDHRLIKCDEKCTRPLCDDTAHLCNKRCYENCGPCRYLVPHELDCGHKIQMECHIDISTYNCKELVSTKLPCDHVADKPCAVDPETFNCPHPCDTRVEPCGHACVKNCHIRMDPDHLEYKCWKPCIQSREGCKETENKHICRRMCFQKPCEPCNKDLKKRKSCGHVFTIACRLDVETVKCEKPCRQKLPCGHKCKNKCYKKCEPCEVLVEKTIPECQHKVKIKCHETPQRQHCKSRNCPRLLACGHKCTNPCKSTCTENCKEVVDCNMQTQCGHTLTRIRCSIKDTNDAELLLKNCTQPCGIELKCKHKCSGTCGECRQYRIHKRCTEKCGVPLVCNHECEIPCRKACKPCTRSCKIRCKHNKCKLECGEPCTPCSSPCGRKCKHVECFKLCGDICDVPPCTEKCRKKLKCGHSCVGFCGDPCPPLCRICDKEELTVIFFGSEDDAHAIFVLLNDCKHIFEHSGLETWLKQGGNQIQFKTCPRCKTNITSTERYSEYIKMATQDVKLAKIKSFGVPQENKANRKKLLEDLLLVRKDCSQNLLSECHRLRDVLYSLEMRLKPSRNERRQSINKMELNAVKSKIQILVYIIGCFEGIKQSYTSNDPTILQLIMLLKVLSRSEDYVTDQEIEDLELEIKRLNRMIQLDKIKDSSQFNYAQTNNSTVKKLTESIQEIIFAQQRYTDLIDNTVKGNLKDLADKVECAVNITDKERMDIVKAIGLEKGHWFKCPNGHPYAIGECGGAMQVAKCFCGAEIGGFGHHLLNSNQLANEMDGATRHAWPGGLH